MNFLTIENLNEFGQSFINNPILIFTVIIFGIVILFLSGGVIYSIGFILYNYYKENKERLYKFNKHKSKSKNKNEI